MSDLKSQIREALRKRSQPCACLDGRRVDQGCFGGTCEDEVDRVAAVIEPMVKALEEARGALRLACDLAMARGFEGEALTYINATREINTALSPKATP